MSLVDVPAQAGDLQTVRAPSLRTLRRLLRRPIAVAAILVITVIYGAGILAPWIAPYKFSETDFENRFSGPTQDHLFGSDRLGRDVFSRVVWSAQTTVIVSVATLATGGLILGVGLGLLAGYAGGRVDNLIMRVGEVMSSVPTFLLLLIINASLRDRFQDLFRDIEDLTGVDGLVRAGIQNYFLVFGALSIFSWVGMARLIRSQTLALREADFVLAAKSMGAGTPRVLFRHLLPNVTSLLVVNITAALGSAAAAEIGLSFLGVGVSRASFGILISEYAPYVRTNFELVMYPLLVVSSLMLSFNLLGDALTDVFSPRRR